MSELLNIYLNDHALGSTLGRDLARRAAANNAESGIYGPPLARIARAIDQDRQSLFDLMKELDVSVNHPKLVLGWVGEKLGRIKPNNHLFSRSPLSRIVELEGLLIGVRGKLGLWQALERVPRAASARSVDLPALIKRAKEQHDEIDQLRLRAAGEVFN